MVPQGPHEQRPVSEADIQAYTDGSLSGERATRVRGYLARRPGEWHRILFYRRLNAQMRRSFGEAALAGDVPALTRVRTPARGPRRWLLALAGALALVAASLAWLAASEPSPQALNNAAVMALMEAGGGAQPMPGESGASDTLADALVPGTPAALAAPATAPAPFDLRAVGLRFVASGTMELGPFARAQRWLYVNADGQPVVLLASRAWFARAAPQWSARRVGELRLIGWIGRGERWVLAGNARTHGLMRAADAATQQLEARQETSGDALNPAMRGQTRMEHGHP
ncbi:transcriptional regulator [Paraburkholderia sp. J67]|uniref:anti-sigma factor family protein n=1 Tax=Paraburkholderia sp. J67 TaxID=2805435 RepID=UPI002ABE3EB8|nr:transcriptional regulator [Paraburkholderia sp. J67]